MATLTPTAFFPLAAVFHYGSQHFDQVTIGKLALLLHIFVTVNSNHIRLAISIRIKLNYFADSNTSNKWYSEVD